MTVYASKKLTNTIELTIFDLNGGFLRKKTFLNFETFLGPFYFVCFVMTHSVFVTGGLSKIGDCSSWLCKVCYKVKSFSGYIYVIDLADECFEFWYWLSLFRENDAVIWFLHKICIKSKKYSNIIVICQNIVGQNCR